VYAGVEPLSGREHRARETCPTLADAKMALTRLQRQVDERKHPKSGITVREAIQQWLEVAELGGDDPRAI
jgi:integrase